VICALHAGRKLVGLVAAGALLAACPPPPPVDTGVPVVPDAFVEVGFNSLDGFVDIVGRLGAAGLVDIDPARVSRSGLEAAGIAGPVVVAVRPAGGEMITARLLEPTRFQAAVSLALGELGLRLERRVGQVDALLGKDGAVVALVRAGNGVVIVVVDPVDVCAEASLVEAMATGALAAPRRQPKAIDVSVAPPKAWSTMVASPITGVITTGPDGVRVDATVPLTVDGRPLWRALSAPSPDTACAVEEGAVIAVRLPPVPGLEDGLDDIGLGDFAALDAFDGRLVVGVHPAPSGTPVNGDDPSSLGSLVVTGRPSKGGKAGLQQSLDEAFAGAGTMRAVGARQVRTVVNADKPWRSVATVIDDDVFALGIGAVVPVDRVAVGMKCPPAPGRLLTVEGAGVVALIERAEPGLAIMRRFAQAAGLPVKDPLATIGGIEHLEVDADPVSDSEAVSLRIRMRLRERK